MTDLTSLAVNDKACSNTFAWLLLKDADARLRAVAEVGAGHDHSVHDKLLAAGLKGVGVMEGEEGAGLKDSKRLEPAAEASEC